jgi:hypothetical protein
MSASASFTLDRYAQIRAHIETGRPRDEALARAGLSVDEWHAGQRAWVDALEREHAEGRSELFLRFNQAFLDERATLVAPPAPAPEAPSKPKPTYISAAMVAFPDLPPAPPPAASSNLNATVDQAFAPPSMPVPFAPASSKKPTLLGFAPAPAPLGGTVEATSPFSGPALPFDPSSKPALPPESAPASHRAPNPALGGTLLASEAPPSAATPFDAPAPPSAPALPSFSLEQYVSLRVELSLDPAKGADVLQRYRISPEQRRLLDRHWSRRLAEDAELRAGYERAYAGYQAWLLGAGGRSP